MQTTFEIVKIVGTLTAFALSGSKLLKASEVFWTTTCPPWLSRSLPGAALVLGALPTALAGVNTATDLGVALLGAIALGLPGLHVSSSPPAAAEPARKDGPA